MDIKDKAMGLIREYKSLADKNDTASANRMNEIRTWLTNHESELPKDQIKDMMNSWLNEIEADVEDIKKQALREQMSDEIHQIIPMRMIAKKYFGKSAAWLSQRLNGTKVRGKVYTLNEDQKRIFNTAMEDLSKTFGSFRLT